MNISCPSCEAKFDISEPGSFQCPSCGFSFDVSKDEFTPDEIEPQIPVVPTLKKCPFCLAEVPFEARKCSHCGEWLVPHEEKPQIVQYVPVENKPKKSNMIYIFLSIFLGNWGVGEFYAGNAFRGCLLVGLNLSGIACVYEKNEFGYVLIFISWIVSLFMSIFTDIEKEKKKKIRDQKKDTPLAIFFLYALAFLFASCVASGCILFYTSKNETFDSAVNIFGGMILFSMVISLMELYISSLCNLKKKKHKIFQTTFFVCICAVMIFSLCTIGYFTHSRLW